jgi:hypothetical protein
VDRGSILLSEFYKAGTKMTPRSRVGIDVLGSRVEAINPVLCDYIYTNTFMRWPLPCSITVLVRQHLEEHLCKYTNGFGCFKYTINIIGPNCE